MKRKQATPEDEETSTSKKTRRGTRSKEASSEPKRRSVRSLLDPAAEHGESPSPENLQDADEEEEQDSVAESTGDENTSEEVTTPSKRRSLRGSMVHAVENGHSARSKNEIEESAEEEEPDGRSETEGQDTEEMEITPMRRTPRRPKTHPTDFANGTPSKNGLLNKRLFATPVKTIRTSGVNGTAQNDDTPRIERNADRSARRKSTRALIERTVLGNTSDNGEEEEDIAQHIYDDSGEELVEDVEEMTLESEDLPITPSKRGRPKGSKNKYRSPTPPQDLPPHEKYFFQNRPGRVKTSNNNLSTLTLLDHEEYFTRSRALEDTHAERLEFLQDVHSKAFNQWYFELSQSFNICLYGFGSKCSLLKKFADFIYASDPSHPPGIVVINGYVPSLTIKDILNTIASAITPPQHTQKLGSQPSEMLDRLLALLEEDETREVFLIIHSIDASPLRRPAAQIILSRLSAHSQIHLTCSADHPSFPLLWDSSLRSNFNFIFHDCTSFQPRAVEIDVVDDVHELLGRSGRRVGGKEGISYVLKSLPENAKNLFRVLIGEQLSSMEFDAPLDPASDDADDEYENEDQRRMGNRSEVGVEYRVLYQKAVEEFICSNEMNFRTLLKEFHDHQMIQSTIDALGTEILSVPFRREELETILEDIMS